MTPHIPCCGCARAISAGDSLSSPSPSLSLSLWRGSHNKQKTWKKMACTFGSTFFMISCQMPPCHWKLNDSFCRLVATSSSKNSADSLLNDLFLHSLLRWQPAEEPVCNSNTAENYLHGCRLTPTVVQPDLSIGSSRFHVSFSILSWQSTPLVWCVVSRVIAQSHLHPRSLPKFHVMETFIPTLWL